MVALVEEIGDSITLSFTTWLTTVLKIRPVFVFIWEIFSRFSGKMPHAANPANERPNKKML